MFELELTVGAFVEAEGRWEAKSSAFEVQNCTTGIFPLLELDKIAKVLATNSKNKADSPSAATSLYIHLKIHFWMGNLSRWNADGYGTAEFNLSELPEIALSSISLKKMATALMTKAKTDREIRWAELFAKRQEEESRILAEREEEKARAEQEAREAQEVDEEE